MERKNNRDKTIVSLSVFILLTATLLAGISLAGIKMAGMDMADILKAYTMGASIQASAAETPAMALPTAKSPAETMEEDRTAVVIDGVKYNLARVNNAIASIDDVRGDALPEELYIPKQLEYKGTTYTVKQFTWGDSVRYFGNNGTWEPDLPIPDLSRSYHSRLRKITFAKGVLVTGDAYRYENLEEVILEDPDDMYEAKYYRCPKLRSLLLGAKVDRFSIDIKDCPSLTATVSASNTKLRVIDGDIYSRNGKILYNVVNGSRNYKVRNGVRKVAGTALIGNTSIRNLFLPDSVEECNILSLPTLKGIRLGKKMKKFHFGSISNKTKIRKICLPENIKTIHCYGYQMKWADKIYLYCGKLKRADFIGNTKRFTFYVKNNTVKKQLRQSGFEGKIIVKTNMKPYGKIKWKK